MKRKSKLVTTITALSLLLAVVVPSASAENITISPSTTKNVESFVIETLSKNQEGFYVPTGYKEVSAISEIEKQGDQLNTITSTIEDYYDLNNNFINSEVKHQEVKNNLNTGKAKELQQKKIFKTNNLYKLN